MPSNKFYKKILYHLGRDNKSSAKSLILLLVLGLIGYGIDHVNSYNHNRIKSDSFISTKENKAEKVADLASIDSWHPLKKYQVTFKRTIDGDTFVVQVGKKDYKVRMLIIDAPEMNFGKDLAPNPFAEDAKEFLNARLTTAQNIFLSVDKGPKQDHYGRLLAYVYLNDSNESLQEEMLKKGLAIVRYVKRPNDSLVDRLRRSEEFARERKKAVWSVAGYVKDHRYKP
ncbi:hypothetical protein D3H64_03020 [Atopobacter sp. AH10]|uniref:thermonuclease family protein n=1 Tax=Atopobacter sp. AH10 TaxID=2315861 RepID=UPI000EF23DF6|nr:thermonuclease family protein [Atopobacter sp. AH10]RLK63735.1 hypothetical protein D3H64_03020 [Atopobacter sp. AH10]